MSMSIDSQMATQSYESLSQEQAEALFKSLSTQKGELYKLQRSLRKDPLKTIHDPKMKAQMDRLAKGRGKKPLTSHISDLIKDINTKLRALMKQFGSQSKVPQAAAQTYGADVGADIEKILRDPNMSLEEKLMMLASTLATKLEKDIEAKMEEWAKASSGSQSKGSAMGGMGDMFQLGASVAGNAAAPGVGGAIAGQVAGQFAGQATGGASQDDKSSKGRQLETQVQLLMQRLNRMTTMISTLMQDDHKTKSGIIANMRV